MSSKLPAVRSEQYVVSSKLPAASCQQSPLRYDEGESAGGGAGHLRVVSRAASSHWPLDTLCPYTYQAEKEALEDTGAMELEQALHLSCNPTPTPTPTPSPSPNPDPKEEPLDEASEPPLDGSGLAYVRSLFGGGGSAPRARPAALPSAPAWPSRMPSASQMRAAV